MTGKVNFSHISQFLPKSTINKLKYECQKQKNDDMTVTKNFIETNNHEQVSRLFGVNLRLLDIHAAKIAKICILQTFWPVIQLINHLVKIRKKSFFHTVVGSTVCFCPMLHRCKKCSDCADFCYFCSISVQYP